MKAVKSVNKNVKSKIFSKSKSKNNFEINKIKVINNGEEQNDMDNINKIILNINISKIKKIKFEFYSNQDAVILTQRFLIQNDLMEITEFKKKDIFNQINNELIKFEVNFKMFLSQVQK